MSKSFSQSEVASHNKTSDLYIIVDEDVYDLTKFQDEHPGTSSLPLFFTLLIGLTLVKAARKVHIPESADTTVRATNARSSSTASGWKRRIQAVLEIP
jgi:hypothetical protein